MQMIRAGKVVLLFCMTSRMKKVRRGKIRF